MTTNSFYGTYLGNAGAVGPANPLVAGNPFGPQFVVPQRGIRGMSPGDLEDAIKWDPKSEKQLRDLNRGIKPGGIQLPLASVNSGTPMGNAGFFAGPQYGQQMPTGFKNKTVS
jgi:hypothetical protein